MKDPRKTALRRQFFARYLAVLGMCTPLACPRMAPLKADSPDIRNLLMTGVDVVGGVFRCSSPLALRKEYYEGR